MFSIQMRKSALSMETAVEAARGAPSSSTSRTAVTDLLVVRVKATSRGAVPWVGAAEKSMAWATGWLSLPPPPSRPFSCSVTAILILPRVLSSSGIISRPSVARPSTSTTTRIATRAP